MPNYIFKCGTCNEKKTVYLTFDEYDKHKNDKMNCGCGGIATYSLSDTVGTVYLVSDEIKPYFCLSSGQWIKSRTQKKRVQEEYGLIDGRDIDPAMHKKKSKKLYFS